MAGNNTVNRPQTIQHAMQYGLYLGALLALDTVLSASHSTFLNILHFFVLASILINSYRFAKDYCQTELNGTISFGRCFAYSLNLFFFASLVAALFDIIYYKYINPSYLTEMIAQMQPMLDKILASTPDYSAEMTKQLFTPEQMGMYTIVGQCFYGMILGAIYFPILRRQKAQAE